MTVSILRLAILAATALLILAASPHPAAADDPLPSGLVYAWGDNGSGQLGNGTTTDSALPLPIDGTEDYVAMAAGGYHSLALKSDGTVWAWGGNLFGQLGNGTDVNSSAPVQVPDLNGCVAVAAGTIHSLALKSDGTVWAWGDYLRWPTRVTGLADVVAIAAGGWHSLGVKSDGTVWAWGYNASGQLGDGTTVSCSTPVQVAGLTGCDSVAAGDCHSLALRSDGTVWAWGDNSDGQVGDGTRTNCHVAVPVGDLAGCTAVAAGGTHSAAIDGEQDAWAWGYNSYGQLGNGTTTDSLFPIRVVGIADNTSLACGSRHTVMKGELTSHAVSVGVSPSGAARILRSPNRDTYPHAEEVTIEATPYLGWVFVGFSGLPSGAASGGVGVVSFNVLEDANVTANFVLLEEGLLLEVGVFPSDAGTAAAAPEKTYYERGEEVSVEAQPAEGYEFDHWLGGLSGEGATASFNIERHTSLTAVMRRVPTAGLVCAWGGNGYGQLGDGTTTNRWAPIELPDLGPCLAVAGGTDHSLALKADGTVWAWGRNTHGQLGDGTSVSRSTPGQVPGLTDCVAVAAGYLHSAALKADGTVWTWGAGAYGQLGDGSQSTRRVPAQVPWLPRCCGLAAGANMCLALGTDGTIWAWGQNNYGQLGDGTTSDQSVPVPVVVLNDAVAVAAGYAHSMALRADGTVWAWGRNDYGQLGDGTTTNRSTPVQAPPLTGCNAIAVGQYHSLAAKPDRTLWTWGRNNFGQLGDGQNINRSIPGSVATVTNCLAMGAGYNHSLTVLSDRTVYAWGSNSVGQIGDATTLSRSLPVPSLAVVDASRVTGGTNHTLAIADVAMHTVNAEAAPPEAGTVLRTPDRQAYWRGEGVTLEAAAMPGWQFVGWSGLPAGCDDSEAVVSFTVTDNVEAAAHFAMIREGFILTVHVFPPNGGSVVATPDKSLYDFGETVTVQAEPSEGYVFSHWQGYLSGGTATQSFVMTQDRTIAAIMKPVRPPGQLCVWGRNNYGQLGDGTTTDATLPVEIVGMDDCIEAVGGSSHSLALKADGTVWAWGLNTYGQLGDGTTANHFAPAQVGGLPDCVAVAAGASHCLALASDGSVWAWGRNDYGQLGDGTSTQHDTPVQVSGLVDCVAVAAGELHSLAVDVNGAVWAWGYNYYGQLGDGTTTHRYTPVQVVGLTDGVAVAAGTYHSMAVKFDGTAWTWGYNKYGQLGDKTTTNRSTPVQVSHMYGCAAVATTKGHHSAALKSLATAWAWGRNNYGQLGNGLTIDSVSSTRVAGLTNIVAVAAGAYHGLAADSANAAWAWGFNYYGQLGDGTTTNRLTAVRVLGLANASRPAAGGNHSLAIGNVRSYSLIAEAIPAEGGSATCSPDRQTFWHGETVTLQATTLPGWLFVGWSGLPAGCDPQDATVSFSVCENLNVVAMFAEPTAHLAILPHAGGDVTGDPEGDYPLNVTVHLHAAAHEDYRFVRWRVNGSEASTAADLDLVMDDDKTVEAVFAYQCTLTVINGTGSGVYDEGAVVEIVADWTAAQFATWTGDTATVADVLSPTTTITVDADCTVTAVPVMTDAITVTADWDWVYQNTPNTLARGGHRIVLEVEVLNAMGNEAFEVTVEKLAGSGPGEVTVEDDPEGDPLTKIVYGSLRTDGLAGTGDLTLRVTVAGDVAGEMAADVPLVVRRLGDIDGNGGPEPGDLSVLINKLNGVDPSGLPDRAFDLDANGGIEPTDMSTLINILNALPVS